MNRLRKYFAFSLDLAVRLDTGQRNPHPLRCTCGGVMLAYFDSETGSELLCIECDTFERVPTQKTMDCSIQGGSETPNPHPTTPNP